MKFKLRPYQIQAVDLLRQDIITNRNKYKDRLPRPILCLPTGAGKTVTFSYLAEQAQIKNKRVAVVCHRVELVEQAKKTLMAYGLNPLMMSFGMVQTYVRSPDKIPQMDVCIIDECHIGNFRKFVDLLHPDIQIIGATATPIGATKKRPLREVFDSVVCPVAIKQLVEQNYLSKPNYKIWQINESQLEKDFSGEFTSSSQSKVFSITDLLEAVNQRYGKTIVFCASIKMTLEVAEVIPNAFFVHSRMTQKQRDEIVLKFKETPNSIIVNCGILTAGFDEPSLETVILYRATTSKALYLQMCGRGSRITDEKNNFWIYDLGGNVERLLKWEAEINWNVMFDLQGRKLTDKAAPMKKCCNKDCEAIIYASTTICPYCQTKQPIKEKKSLQATDIKVISHFSELPKNLQKPYHLLSVPELLERAKYGSSNTGRPYKISWIVNQLRIRDTFKEDIKELAEIKGYKSGWIKMQVEGYN